MATREHESVGPPFGIAHVTVVPENFDPGWVDERPRDRADRESEE